MTAINDVTDYAQERDVAVITIDSPPVNALGLGVRQGVGLGLARAFADDGVAAAIIICGGRTFFAGADIKEFGRPMASPVLRELAVQIEAGKKPVVAAMHGTALGGGFEIALACHWRIAGASAKMGLPEVKLGLLAGAGGTQRLPRLIGAEKALEMVVFGEPIGAAEALGLGLIDAVAETDLRTEAIAFARQAAGATNALKRVRDAAPAAVDPALFQRFRETHAERLRGFEAPEASIQCIEAALEESFDSGMKTERRLFDGLMAGNQCAAQRYIFFAEREVAKLPRAGVPTTKIGSVDIDGDDSGTVATFLRRRAVQLASDADVRIDRHVTPARWPKDARVILLTEAPFDAHIPRDAAERAIVARFSPTPAQPRALEFAYDPRLSSEALGAALALAKRLELTPLFTFSGAQTLGQRLQARLRKELERQSSAKLQRAARSAGIEDPHSREGAGEGSASPAIERVVAGMINEGARLLEEGAAARASDIDVACVKLGLFRAYLGGPLFQADQIGLNHVIARLREYEAEFGEDYRPAELLIRVAASGGVLKDAVADGTND